MQRWLRSIYTAALPGLAVAFLTLPILADDWPQHLGIQQDATSAETGLLDAWPANGPPELWRHDVGVGFAGPAIVDGQVFLNDRVQGEADVLRVFNLDTGEELWQFRYDAPGRINFPGSRSTPCVTDTHVYMTGGFGHIHAVNRETHRADWQFNIYDRYPDENKRFGYGPSAVIVDDILLITPTAQGDPVVVALNPQTGETVWESQARLETLHSFHTPVVREIAGVRGISVRDRTHVHFVSIDTGQTIWSHQVYEIQGGPHVTIPPVTVLGRNNQYVFCTNGYENGSVLFEVKPIAAAIRIEEVYRIPEGGQVHPAIYYEKYLYLNINENANLLRGRNLQGGLACIDPQNGEVVWKTRNAPNLNRGATTLVDGKLLAFDGDTGELMLIDPGPERFRLISKFVALEGRGNSNNAWSPLVVSDGRLVVRDHRQVVCFDLRQ
ncbi:MAG: PQQ-binding-like beta-propeller repeat protein [Planctomycetota bacterium]